MKIFLYITFLHVKLVYACLKLLPKKNKLLLISKFHSTTSLDFSYIEKYSQELGYKYEIVTLNHRTNSKVKQLMYLYLEVYHLATSRICIIDSYTLSISLLNHEESLKIIQIWHALGAIKKFGHASVGEPWGVNPDVARFFKMHKNYTYCTVGSRNSVEIFSESLNISPDKVKLVGMPRVDYLVDGKQKYINKALVREYYNLGNSDKIILYAPTFRKNQDIPYSILADCLNEKNYNLIIKQHPNDSTKISKSAKYIIDTKFLIYQLLHAVDFLITDYSAIAFESSVVKLPTYFWVYDMEIYSKNVGLFLDLNKELPGACYSDAAKMIHDMDLGNYSFELLDVFSKKFVSFQDGNSTERFLKACL